MVGELPEMRARDSTPYRAPSAVVCGAVNVVKRQGSLAKEVERLTVPPLQNVRDLEAIHEHRLATAVGVRFYAMEHLRLARPRGERQPCCTAHTRKDTERGTCRPGWSSQ